MNRKLVAYFSVGGTTRRVAERLAGAIGADVFEIRPREPYTAADIRWTNPFARCNREMLGRRDVPLAEKPETPEAYDMVFIGFPIWYYGAPNVVRTFVRGTELAGKRIALFATSGGSDMGRTAEKLAPLLGEGARIVGQRRFEAGAGADELRRWAESLG